MCRAGGLLVLLLTALLSGCAHQGVSSGISQDVTLEAHVLSGNAFLKSGEYFDPLPELNLLAVDDDMRQFMEAFVSDSRSRRSRLNSLVSALFNPGILGIRYDPDKTYTAAEVFHYQEANCLSFANLFIALAREQRLKVWYNEVKIPPRWGMQDEDTFLFYRHVNVVVDLGNERKIVDLNLKLYKADYTQKRISDTLAKAHYYNNKAVELIGSGEHKQAFVFQRQALLFAPKQDFLWNNLGAIYRRAGHLREAEFAYLKTLSLNAGQTLAMSNLARLYRLTGDDQKASYYEGEVSRHRMNNPFYRFTLASQSLQKGEAQEALNHIQAALKKEKSEARLYELAAEIHMALGNEAQATLMLDRAVALQKQVALN